MSRPALYLCSFAALAALSVSAISSDAKAQGAQSLPPPSDGAQMLIPEATLMPDETRELRCRAIAAVVQARAHKDITSLEERTSELARDNGQASHTEHSRIADIRARAESDLRAGETIITHYGSAPYPTETMLSEVTKLQPNTLSLEAALCQPAAATAFNIPQ